MRDLAWYEVNALAPIEVTMTYVCDTNLGAPAEVDCSKLEYAQLGTWDDNLQVGPGVVTFPFSSKRTSRLISGSSSTSLNHIHRDLQRCYNSDKSSYPQLGTNKNRRH